MIKTLSCSGVPPKNILNQIRNKFGNSIINARDIYTVLNNSKKEFLNGRTNMEALVEIISTEEFVSDIKLDGLSTVGVFFAHKHSVDFAQRFPTVFIMDCTYKTNKFGMPLLNIVGITSTFETCNVGFAFLAEETKISYEWALSQFKKNSATSPCVKH